MKKISLIALTTTLFVLSGCTQQDEEKPSTLPESKDEQMAYAVGVSAGKSMAKNLASLEGTKINVDADLVVEGFADGIKETSQLDDKTLQSLIAEFRGNISLAMQKKRKDEAAKQAEEASGNLAKGAAFLEENKSKEGVVTLESGLQYKIIQAGDGKSPTITDQVKVNYKGTLIDGTQFDSSFDRGQPAVFGVNRVVKGWQEGIPLMKEGAKWQFFIPSELGYGMRGRPNIPAGSVLIFQVDLLEVLPKPEAKATDK